VTVNTVKLLRKIYISNKCFFFFNFPLKESWKTASGSPQKY